ncbi:unnamed protein product [Candidula unifasciata]|uniref:Uncharacterized protein n=1 Tax=Candidula unifasciata TaxID=100452 RepID=A0A8S3YT12_9EUPU|nr:unnamed protein product [Candidula unifasciata]
MSSHILHKPQRELNGMSLYFFQDVAIIVFSRGENRLNLEFVQTLDTLLDDVQSSETCKGLITTGSGKFYGNGLDLEWMATLTQPDLYSFISTFQRLLKRILYFPLPTLAALNGHAYAGGALFAFAHDLRTFHQGKGWLCLNEVFIERRFSDFHLSFLKIKVGYGKNLTDAVVLGRRFTPEEAFTAGLTHAIPKESVLLAESVRLLKAFHGKSGYPRDSLANMKEDVYRDCLAAYEKDIQRFGDLASKL